MKSAAAIVWCLGISCAMPALAQDSLPGTYKGSFPIQTNAGNVDIGVTLVIASVEDGKIKGTGTYHRGTCAGDYPVQGSVRDSGIGVISAKGGPAGDCVFGFKGKIEGNRLVGNVGRYQIELRK